MQLKSVKENNGMIFAIYNIPYFVLFLIEEDDTFLGSWKHLPKCYENDDDNEKRTNQGKIMNKSLLRMSHRKGNKENKWLNEKNKQLHIKLFFLFVF